MQRNRSEHGIARSDQGEVWDEVAKNLNDLKAASATSSLTDGFVAAEGRLDEYRQTLKLPENAAGVLVASGERVFGMDLFDSPATLAVIEKRLVDAYCMDAVRDDNDAPPADPEVARQFIARVAEYVRPRSPALGLGEELEIAGDGIVGSALLYGDKICHLAAFSDAN